MGDLSEHWDVAPDGKQITFALRKGVKYHDGSDFTCADAKYSLEKLGDPKRASPTLSSVMANVFVSADCRDDFTLIRALKQPSPAILALLADAHTVMMKAGIAEQVDRKDTKFLVGTGPFKFKSYTPGIDFRAERNPSYWKTGVPHLDGYQAVVMVDITKGAGSLSLCGSCHRDQRHSIEKCGPSSPMRAPRGAGKRYLCPHPPLACA